MKKFLTIVLSICLLSVTVFTSCNKKEEVKLEIATTTSDLKKYTKDRTDEAAIRGLYEVGFQNIDFSMYSITENSVYMQDNWREKILQLKAVADELGMKFVQAHSPGGNPLSQNPQEVESLIATTIRSIEICEVLGIENTVVHAGWRGGLTKYQWFEANKSFYERLLPTAERCGVNVLCENSTSKNMGSNYYINTGEDMREFIEYVDHPNFHGCWDTGHANCEEGDQYDDIVELGNEMYAIHYADNLGDADTHLLPFIGNLNHDSIMKALKEIKFKGYFTLECDGKDRCKQDWNGPELPLFQDYQSMYSLREFPRYLTRIEQEKLLYETAKYILSSYEMLAK